MKQAILRRGLALLLAAAALGTVLAGAGADSAAALWQSVSRRPHLSRGLLRWELGDLLGLDGLSAATVLALGQSPVLLAGRSLAVQEDGVVFSLPPKKSVVSQLPTMVSALSL